MGHRFTHEEAVAAGRKGGMAYARNMGFSPRSVLADAKAAYEKGVKDGYQIGYTKGKNDSNRTDTSVPNTKPSPHYACKYGGPNKTDVFITSFNGAHRFSRNGEIKKYRPRLRTSPGGIPNERYEAPSGMSFDRQYVWLDKGLECIIVGDVVFTRAPDMRFCH